MIAFQILEIPLSKTLPLQASRFLSAHQTGVHLHTVHTPTVSCFQLKTQDRQSLNKKLLLNNFLNRAVKTGLSTSRQETPAKKEKIRKAIQLQSVKLQIGTRLSGKQRSSRPLGAMMQLKGSLDGQSSLWNQWPCAMYT